MTPDHSGRAAGQPLTRVELLSWGTVRTGLAQIALGSGLLAVGLILQTFRADIGDALAWLPGGDSDLFGILAGITAAVLVLAMVVAGGSIVIGLLTCCAAPRRFGVRGLMIAYFCCLLAIAGVLAVRYVQERLTLQEAMDKIMAERDQKPMKEGEDRDIMPRIPDREAGSKPYSLGEITEMALPYFLSLTSLLAGVFFLLFLRRLAEIAGKNSQVVHVNMFLAVYVLLSVFHLYARKMPIFEPAYFTYTLTLLGLLIGWFAVLTSRVRTGLTEMLLEK
jgi:hypothetical protein